MMIIIISDKAKQRNFTDWETDFRQKCIIIIIIAAFLIHKGLFALNFQIISLPKTA